VSHRLDEIFDLCDRVTVLRDGATVAMFDVPDVTPDRVVSAMVGRSVDGGQRAARDVLGEAVLEVRDLSVFKPRAGRFNGGPKRAEHAVSHASFTLHKGEILAVCGAMGAGRTALLSALFGCAKAGFSGSVTLDGAPLRLDSPEHSIRQGLAFVPEDRKGRGLVLGMSVAENLALPTLATTEDQTRFGLVDSEGEALLADRRIRSLHIRGDAKVAVSTLSGGNQQKVVLGKWLEQPPKVLLLDEPTRGIDVGAREEIYGILNDLARRGVGILLASSDLAEVVRLARRILVLRNGRIVGELDGADTTEADIVELSTGAVVAGSHSAAHDTPTST
jgi:ABC-type sugar transport system ATPase subunit